MTSYVYLFIFFVILFHSSIFVYLKSDHVWTTSEKGKQWIKLGAGRDSKTAHKTSENSPKNCESRETKSTYFQQRSQKLLLFSRHHFTGASYIKQRGVACICDCGFVCVCAERQNLFCCCFSLSFVCFFYMWALLQWKA